MLGPSQEGSERNRPPSLDIRVSTPGLSAWPDSDALNRDMVSPPGALVAGSAVQVHRLVLHLVGRNTSRVIQSAHHRINDAQRHRTSQVSCESTCLQTELSSNSDLDFSSLS
jgi:hypothetical protein